ncbi:putative recombination initiation defects 3 isoform X1 [Rhododendron vialii]|uniref:putative recombination initiation defects 3 isoform X1 n=1 Tax=Rhododendron vialii TaxID=182163 RepID=UPI00265FA332|nr:putative recombination initiation defects 3 isoform X1 [Rhododendron vialii]XP_058224146.1 putative recombination initiation defects 3 isoform X1 [Rhododendron vialii]
MKLKINKACDLSSISVLPPHTRRSSIGPSGPGSSSVFGRSQASQLRSQPSQHSFSQQGVSSQHGMFSQLSQNSLDEIVTNDQRISSQERENPVKKLSCLPPISYSLEESQMQVSRSSSNLMRKWNSSSVLDHRSQTSEELERRIGMMETSLNRFGMIMDSVQSDIMQVNKGTKEALMEIEDVRQKLIANGNLLQVMAKGQEDIKTNLAGGIKSLSDQVSQDTDGEKLQEISSFILTLPEQIDVYLQKMKSELCNKLTQEIQAMVCSLKVPNQHHLTPAILLEEGISCRSVQQQMQPLKGPEMPPRSCGKTALLPKIEVGSWTSVKTEQATFTHRGTSKKHKQKRMSPIELEREWRIPIESDEEIDGGFSCLLEGKETDVGNYSMAEAKEETKRILRKARRRKRKHSNTIILD